MIQGRRVVAAACVVAFAVGLTGGALARGNDEDLFPILNDGRGGGTTDLDRITVIGERPRFGFIGMPTFSMPGGQPGDGGLFDRNEGEPHVEESSGEADNPDPDQPCAGNPILPGTRNKIETEMDFVSSGEMALGLSRTYNLNWYGRGLFGSKWTSNLDYRLTFSDDVQVCYPRQGGGNCGIGSSTQIHAWRPDGRKILYVRNPNDGIFYEDKPSAVSRIVRQHDGNFVLYGETSEVETYSSSGYIVSVRNEQGIGWEFSYVNGTYPHRVTHTSGRYIEFTWQGQHLTEVRDPAGNQHRYTYHADRFNGGRHVLASAVRPGSPETTVTYHYHNLQHGQRLAGKSYDGVRYSTFTYDAMGYPASTEHQGHNRYSFSYSIGAGNVWTVTETNPLGKQTTSEYRNGKLLTVVGHPSTHTAPAPAGATPTTTTATST